MRLRQNLFGCGTLGMVRQISLQGCKAGCELLLMDMLQPALEMVIRFQL
jgi:hypothetical protein